jgi:uncharacterized repeat protein (TIGR01451 family)
MKKFFFLFVVIITALAAGAQLSKSDSVTVAQLVYKNAKGIGLSENDLSNYIISSSYVTNEGIRLVYLNQSYMGIPVYNQIHVLAFKESKLVSVAGGRIPLAEQKVTAKNGLPKISAQDAMWTALSDIKVNLPMQKSELPEPAINNRGQLEFGRVGIASLPITATLIWLPVNEREIKLAWQFFVAPAGTSDSWLLNVDATEGLSISKENITIYEQPAGKVEMSGPVHPPSPDFYENCVALKKKFNSGFIVNAPQAVNNVTYRVVKYPAESPIHTGGIPSLHTNPWTMAGGNATSLQWHNDGTNYYDSTRGNNVWAAEDRNATDAVIDKAAVSQTPQPNLTFNFIPDFTQSPVLTAPPNQQFGITNLFYWVNIMHDISYLYGFDEAAGNFQNDNQGRGGLGQDYVLADAQDGFTVNNANFLPTPDGQKPRIQMFLFTYSAAPKDGDADNGIIAHEYAHGISTRLTGGPGTVSCLRNGEQPSEGWSDFYSLMLTTNWATAAVTDGNLARTIGTYSLGQPVNGNGFRAYPYSTNIATNPLVYSKNLPDEVHAVGTVWCTALWEMTWEMIKLTGINRNLFNASGVGGNSAAMKLVTEAMKLQPCNPGFIDARNAILKADTLFFNGLYSCAIWKAFAKRGMGRNASQGTSYFSNDQVADFSADNTVLTLSQNTTTVTPGQNITYTNRLTAGGCISITDYYITDTLPASVTYISGGNYNAATRTVKFGPITLSAGQSQTYSFTVNLNNGTYFTPITKFNETVPEPVISNTWTAAPAGSWSVSTSTSISSPYSFFTDDPGTISDKTLTSDAFTIQPVTPSNFTTLSFQHNYNSEFGKDGGVIEISTDGGTTWADLGSKIISEKYAALLVGANLLAGRYAYTGNSNGFVKTEINLSFYAGQTVRFRFRFASDTSNGGGGWYIDDIRLNSIPAVSMQSDLYTSGNQLILVADAVTKITRGCIQAPSIILQPFSVTTCPGNTATFRIMASGSPLNYQWQVNSGGGFTDIAENGNYTGTTSSQLTISTVSAASNGYAYRCIISNECTAPLASNTVYLFAGAITASTPIAVITTEPANITTCFGIALSPVSFSVLASGSSLSYQWQADMGNGFQNIADVSVYSGVHSATLLITTIGENMTGYKYRCLVSNNCAAVVLSKSATLTIRKQIKIISFPNSFYSCGTDKVSFSFSFSAINVASYRWQVRTGAGVFVDIINAPPYSGVNTNTLSFTNATASLSGNRYRCVFTDSCGGEYFFQAVPFEQYSLFVTIIPSIGLNTTSSQMVCAQTSTTAVNFTTNAQSNAIITWTNNTPEIGLPASGSGNIPSFTALNNTNVPITATIVVEAVNNCSTVTRTFTITVNPKVSLNPISNQAVCAGTSTSAIDFGIPASAGATINWINNTPSIGLAAGGSGNIPSFIAVNNTKVPVTATIFVNASNSCGGTGSIFTITVNPKVSLNPISNQSVCAGTSTSAIDFGIPASAGATINWTNNTPSIGLAAVGSGNIPAFNAINNSNAPVTATIIVTASNSCGGSGRVFTITVNPLPLLNAITNQVVCAQATTLPIDLSSPTTGSVLSYTWTNSTPSIGLSAGGIGNIPSFVAGNTGNTLLTANITAKVTNACGTGSRNFTITVRPVVTVNPVTNQVLYAGAATNAINFSSSVTGGTVAYRWTNNKPSIGLAAAGTGSIGSFYAINNTCDVVTAAITVTPVNSYNGISCTGTSRTFTITVTPIAGKQSYSSEAVLGISSKNQNILPEVTNKEFDVEVFPNPSTGNFGIYVTSERAEIVTVRIFNINGVMVKKVQTAAAGSG